MLMNQLGRKGVILRKRMYESRFPLKGKTIKLNIKEDKANQLIPRLLETGLVDSDPNLREDFGARASDKFCLKLSNYFISFFLVKRDEVQALQNKKT
jgi:hypothetical protein